MWNDIGGAATLLAMVVCGVFFLYAAPSLIEAISDRIRYGTQTPADDIDEDDEPENEKAPASTPPKPVAAAKTAAKPAETKAAA